MRRCELIDKIYALKGIGYEIKQMKRAKYPCFIALFSNRAWVFHFIPGGIREAIVIDYFLDMKRIDRKRVEMNGLDLVSIISNKKEN